jgi:hypothetical protein
MVSLHELQDGRPNRRCYKLELGCFKAEGGPTMIGPMVLLGAAAVLRAAGWIVSVAFLLEEGSVHC